MNHRCHWPGCQVEVPPDKFTCRRHWFALPKPIRREIWRHYRKGQEVTKDPSDAYIRAARRAREWIYANHPPLQQLQLDFAQ
jgi:hypothetical protein